ncbi:MAG: hypothetical protein HZB39_01260 [Planctomycetes bacterium]|nr:hypothetical protein [Planctomycetota bacterium]
MTHTASVALSVVCAVAITAGGILWSESRRTEPQPVAPGVDPELRNLLGRVEQRLAALEQRPSAPAQTEIARSEASLTRGDVEAIVAEAMKSAGASAVPADSAVASESAPFTLDGAFRDLRAAEGDERRAAIWAAARKAGKQKELLALFEAAAKGAPNDATAQFQYGQACIYSLLGTQDFMEQGVLSQLADKAFDQALEVDERHWEARYSKAVSYTFWPDFLGKKKEAIAHLQTLIEQQEAARPEPKHIETYLTLGNVLAQQGKDDEARKIWERGYDRFPTDLRLKEKLGR